MKNHKTVIMSMIITNKLKCYIPYNLKLWHMYFFNIILLFMQKYNIPTSC